LHVDEERCTGCGSCASACPREAIVLLDNVALIDHGRCDSCGICRDACPSGAIQMANAGLPEARLIAPLARRDRAPLVRGAMSLAKRLATIVAPMAFDATVATFDRWLALRANPTAAAAPHERSRGGRRRERRGWQQ
jgi:Fe-S-cluster-containing hydrogenase component 2